MNVVEDAKRPLTGGEELVWLVARTILRLSPAVKDTEVSTPALMMVYYITRLAFLSGEAP